MLGFTDAGLLTNCKTIARLASGIAEASVPPSPFLDDSLLNCSGNGMNSGSTFFLDRVIAFTIHIWYPSADQSWKIIKVKCIIATRTCLKSVLRITTDHCSLYCLGLFYWNEGKQIIVWPQKVHFILCIVWLSCSNTSITINSFIENNFSLTDSATAQAMTHQAFDAERVLAYRVWHVWAIIPAQRAHNHRTERWPDGEATSLPRKCKACTVRSPTQTRDWSRAAGIVSRGKDKTVRNHQASG